MIAEWEDIIFNPLNIPICSELHSVCILIMMEQQFDKVKKTTTCFLRERCYYGAYWLS